MSTATITTGFAPAADGGLVLVTAAPVPAAAHTNAAGSARGTGKSHLRLTARGRRVFTGLAALPLVIAALAFALNGGVATASSSGSDVPVETVTVEAGQSLWELASDIAPDADPRDVIADLVSFNDLTTTAITPGQQLDVPTAYSR